MKGRWSDIDEKAIEYMRATLKEEIHSAPDFPELTGDRRLLRFIRGAKYDVDKAIESYKQMLKWRVENNVDAIREDIVKNGIRHPKDFPFGETILSHFPLIIDNPDMVDCEGNPLSVERISFSPSKVLEDVDLGQFLRFHLYCCELRLLTLEQLSEDQEA
eukprot:CAMPEP_0194662768 /NCGR_PEP_ID=MMETSP0295-20121207/401_1 /TAXON_ID=39354 /ORGANISM="Heterosigma akashiwo, Strain CCMP2393" /LENGTH=159 /DNA_ID=CAMNT_0039544059 /DNA_START=284 /DNA_END=760 /DNA_ORIENTATION=-